MATHLRRLAIVQLQGQRGGLLLKAPDLGADGAQPLLEAAQHRLHARQDAVTRTDLHRMPTQHTSGRGHCDVTDVGFQTDYFCDFVRPLFEAPHRIKVYRWQLSHVQRTSLCSVTRLSFSEM